MSFLKISDPLKRDAIVKEYLELKKKIRSNFLSERIGEQQLQTDLSKFYKPITETQKATAREITEGLKPVREGLETIRKEVHGIPEFILGRDAIKEYEKELEEDKEYEEKQKEEEEEEDEEEDESVGEIARYYLNKQYRDTTFGIKKRIVKNEKHHYIGKTHVIIYDNDIFLPDYNETFEGTDGLWELITSRDPVNFNEEDKDNYERLIIKTNVIHRGDDPKNPHPKGNRGKKWKKLIGPIWYERQGFSEEDAIKMANNRRYRERLVKKMRKIKSEYEGEGVVVIPSDPNALLERLDLLLASQEAGHTGVRNELVSICDELKRQGVLNTKAYKKLNHLIKNDSS